MTAAPSVPTLLFPHGFGDVIQALPAFRAYAAKIGQPLDVGVLSRLPACREVLEHQPYVREVFGLPDPWNDFAPANTREGYGRGRAAIEMRHPEGFYVPTARPLSPLDVRMAKVFRVADELGVKLEDLSPAISPGLDPAEVKAGRAWAREQHAEGCLFVLAHGASGNPAKDLEPRRLVEAVCRNTPHRFAVLPLKDQHGASRSVAFHWGAIDACDLFVGVDSGPAHLASTTRTPVLWAFTVTPIEQAIPLYREVSVVASRTLRDGWETWATENRAVLKHKVNTLEAV